jgi:hypothetical protein
MLQSAYAQVPTSGCEYAWLASMHAGVPPAHQPQPGAAVQVVQLALRFSHSPGQLPAQVANDDPSHELSAEPETPIASHRPLLEQKPQPAREVHDWQSVNVEHGSPAITGTGR